MSIHYLYRLNGGEVLGMSINAEAYASVNPTYLGVVMDPPEPDGRNLQPLKSFSAGTIRDATPAEIANFPVAESVDQNLMDREAAKDLYIEIGVTRKAYRALVRVLIDEINILRQQQRPSLPDRTVAQAVTAIKARIDAGDYD